MKDNNKVVFKVADGQSVSLTPHQVEYLKLRVRGQGGKLKGSTDQTIAQKIRAATGWEMNRIQMFCRFAYKVGLVEL